MSSRKVPYRESKQFEETDWQSFHFDPYPWAGFVVKNSLFYSSTDNKPNLSKIATGDVLEYETEDVKRVPWVRLCTGT